jgi:hypothetical protein
MRETSGPTARTWGGFAPFKLSVTVAAGTFDAYRIEIFEQWVVAAAYSGTSKATAWWSPAVKMFVKHKHGDPGDPRWSYELTAFELEPE